MHTSSADPIENKTHHRRKRTGWLSLTGLRRSLIYRPLAILLSLLVLPAVSWMESGDGGPKPFQAAAQIISSGCFADSASNSIIRNYCNADGSINYRTDLVQLEADGVASYLSEHGLPATDAHLIYDFGRSDLRSAVRANILLILHGIIIKAPNARLPHETNLYNWLSGIVQQNEIALYTNAINEFLRWQSDPCLFTLDPVIASAYNLSYDGVPFCAGSASLFSGPSVPAASYFRAFGLKKSYGAAADQYPYFSSIMAKTAVNVGVALGLAVAVAWGVSAATFVPVIVAVAAGPAAPALITTVTGLSAFGAVGLAVGVVAIVLAAIAIGVAAGLELYVNQQTLNDIHDMSNTLNQVKSTAPDLLAFATDSSGLGNYKLQMSVIAQTVPEVASTAVLPTHQNGIDTNFSIQNSGSPTPTISSTLGYKDWNGNTWSAQTSGGWFVQACSGAKCDQADSIHGDLEYLDWSGAKWTASRLGTIFSNTKLEPASTDKDCPADKLTGLTPGSDFSNCKTYVSTSIPLTDSNGKFVRVSLSAWAPPVFSSPSTVPFVPGVASAQTITATGNPTPTICFTSGNLPAGFSLNGGSCGQGSFQLTYDGTAVSEGLYNLTLTASGNGSPVTQPFSVAVTHQLSITSASSVTTIPSLPVNFLVTTTGFPAPSLRLDASFSLPAGLTFTDNHDGTATISGALSQLGIFACVHGPTDTNPAGSPCGIIASNSQGTVEQAFAINTNTAPQGSVVPPTSTTFITGIANRVVLSSAGAITPVTTWAFSSNPDAPWATLQTSVFERGIATLSGTPPIGTTGTFTVGVAPFPLYSASDPSLLFFTPYTINVNNTPVFTNPNTAEFTAGTFSLFPVSVNMGNVSLPGTLPNGLSFAAGNPGSISGTAAPGTGGQYTVRLVDDAGSAGSTTQYLNLNVYEGPHVTSPNSVTFIAGTPGSFAVTTTGFPNVSTHPVSPTSLPPTSPTQGSGMYFTVTGLPSGLQASNLTPQGYAGGTLTIQGTVTSANAGVYPVQITAQNGAGTTQQTLTINVIKIAGPAPASGTTCNGNYNGTFTGNLTVSSGQNCSFIAGGVNGNVTVSGGSLALKNANVAGNLTIQGSAGFSLGPGTTIGKNLTIQNLASGSTQSQVCQVSVAGNVQVSSNAIPVSIGSPQTFCYGNTVAGNMDIQGNTGSVAVFDNSVQKSLSCSSNTSITGGANAASKKNGQCAAF